MIAIIGEIKIRLNGDEMLIPAFLGLHIHRNDAVLYNCKRAETIKPVYSVEPKEHITHPTVNPVHAAGRRLCCFDRKKTFTD